MKKPDILHFKREAEKMRNPIDKTVHELLASDPLLSSDLIVPVLLDLVEVKDFIAFARAQAPKQVGDTVESSLRGTMVLQFKAIIEKVRSDSF
jgi:hypothetical protein